MSRNVTEIVDLANHRDLPIDELCHALDLATHDERVAATRQFSASSLRQLYLASEGRPVPFDYMVPHTDELREVIHVGQNSLPAFRHFQKRFCRPSEAHGAGTPKVWGYNHNWYQAVASPGYFVGYSDTRTGEFVIDYTVTPPEKPSAWPRILDNKKKLGPLIYNGMIDRLWRVSSHVTIGRAFKKGPMPAFFSLVRQD